MQRGIIAHFHADDMQQIVVEIFTVYPFNQQRHIISRLCAGQNGRVGHRQKLITIGYCHRIFVPTMSLIIAFIQQAVVNGCQSLVVLLSALSRNLKRLQLRG